MASKTTYEILSDFLKIQKRNLVSKNFLSWEQARKKTLGFRLKKFLQSFAETETVIQLIAWSLYMTVLIVFTINDLYTILQQYIEQPATTVISMNYNQSFRLSNATICIPYWQFEILDRAASETLNETVNGGVEIENQGKWKEMAQVEKELIWNKTKNEFLNEQMSYNSFSMALYYLYVIGRLNNPNIYSVLPPYNPRMMESFGTESELFVDVLQPLYQHLNLSMPELQEKAAKHLCQLLRVSGTWHIYKTDSIKLLGEVCNVVYMGVKVDGNDEPCQICLQLPFSRFEYFPGNFFLVSWQLRDPYTTLRMPDDYFEEKLKDAESFLDLEGAKYPYSQPTKRSVLILKEGKLNQFSAEVSAVYSLLKENSTGHVQCSKEMEDQDECKVSCLAAAKISKCKCKPFLLMSWWPSTDETVPWCNQENHFECLKLLGEELQEDTVLSYSSCLSSCLPPCENWEFRASVERSPPPLYNQTMFELRFVSLTYPTFAQVREKEWSNFISDIGGVVGLWLGWSFASVAPLVVIISGCHKYCSAKRKRRIGREHNMAGIVQGWKKRSLSV